MALGRKKGEGTPVKADFSARAMILPSGAASFKHPKGITLPFEMMNI